MSKSPVFESRSGKPLIQLVALLCFWQSTLVENQAEDAFEKMIRPFFRKNCTKCHGQNKEPKGNIDLFAIQSEKQLLAKPDLINEAIEALDSLDMPPETEPAVPVEERKKIIGVLKQALRNAGTQVMPVQVRRLNRFQYNNSVKDLFRLKLDLFMLSEKLMTRHTNYLTGDVKKVPDQVNVASYALNPKPGMREVKAFPKDLRAAHGFDNQANQLTLSPLLLDAFLRLSVSVVESPDFNEKTVGIWKDFFQQPTEKQNLKTEIRKRIRSFLTLAYRREVSDEILDRYVRYAVTKTESGTSFTDTMKRVASAALSSPMFLYRYHSQGQNEQQFELASNLSYFLWSSGPDRELLELAGKGELSKPEILSQTIERMLADPKIERFLDTFPTQWMQLENVLAATPDPQKHRFFSLDKNYPASLQMLIEPLLLFDAVFVEDRPVIELISPGFGYQSEFLKTWYTSDLKAPRVDTKKIVEQNRVNDRHRQEFTQQIKQASEKLAKLIDPIRERLLAEKQETKESKPVNLKPLAAWEFDGNLKSSIGGLDLTPHGKVSFKDGMAVLNGSYLVSKQIPVDLKAKTLEVWCLPHNLDQSGGGLMGIQGQGDFFDTIVIGERKAKHWISGSNGFSRTLDFAGSTPEPKPNERIHLVMVYKADGTTLLYRNGHPYGKPFKKGRAVFPKKKSQVIFGLRHLPPGGNKYLHVSLDKARLYDRALSQEEVLAANTGHDFFVSAEELSKALSKAETVKRNSLEKEIVTLTNELKKVPGNRDPGRAQRESRDRFDNDMRNKLRAQTFRRTQSPDPRYGGVITNAAIMSMTSGPRRTHPIARGAWIIEVIFNDPPPPPPNDVPPLNEESGDKNQTIREKFKIHRENPDCAGCHSRLDPLGFAMENFDVTGRWRDEYDNGREVDTSGTLLKRVPFTGAVEFKKAITAEKKRFARAFTKHLLRFALARELSATDSLVVDSILARAEKDGHRLKSLIRGIAGSGSFQQNP